MPDANAATVVKGDYLYQALHCSWYRREVFDCVSVAETLFSFLRLFYSHSSHILGDFCFNVILTFIFDYRQFWNNHFCIYKLDIA